MINPYENVGWESVGHVKSMSHMHLHNQNSFEAAIKEGFKHVAATNYQPSVPTYPLDKFFTNIPYDVIGSPNTEKVYTTNLGGAGHFCSLGSFAKGHGHTEGATTTWQNVFDEILSELQFEDGGGVTINHPGDRFFVGFDTYKEMLDHDDRVLGIEIYNRGGAGETKTENTSRSSTPSFGMSFSKPADAAGALPLLIGRCQLTTGVQTCF